VSAAQLQMPDFAMRCSLADAPMDPDSASWCRQGIAVEPPLPWSSWVYCQKLRVHLQQVP